MRAVYSERREHAGAHAARTRWANRSPPIAMRKTVTGAALSPGERVAAAQSVLKRIHNPHPCDNFTGIHVFAEQHDASRRLCAGQNDSVIERNVARLV